MGYDVWTTKDKRKIRVAEMSNLHVLNTLKAIEENRLFTTLSAADMVPCHDLDMACINQTDLMIENEDVREKWLTVFKAEAIRRGLDYTKPPIRRIGIVEWACEKLKKDGWNGGNPTTWFNLIVGEFKKAGFSEPQIDVSNLDGNVSYLHWSFDKGTPMGG